MVEIVLRAEVTDWLASLGDADQKRATRAIDRLLTTFRKQRNNERAEIDRARQVAILDEKEEHDG